MRNCFQSEQIWRAAIQNSLSRKVSRVLGCRRLKTASCCRRARFSSRRLRRALNRRAMVPRQSRMILLSGFWLAGHQDLALRQQLLKDRLLQLPRPMFVGVGQRGASRSRWQTQGPKFPFTRGQASADFTQRLGVSQLTKKHGNEFTPETETAGMTFRFVLDRKSTRLN